MYTAVVLFFSGTGNTWWVADRIKRQLDAKNINASIVPMESLTPKKTDWWIKTADLVLLGWPVYGSDLPQPVKDFIQRLPVSEKGKHVHTFCTQMGFSGDGAWMAQKLLLKKGLIVDTAAHFNMPSNMSMLRGLLGTPNDDKIKRMMVRCDQQVTRYAERLLTGRARIKGRYGFLLGCLQRVPYRLFANKMKKQVGVDKDRCTGCGLCAELCPMGNITLKEKPEFAQQCTMCLRCYSFCPTSAITFYGRLRDLDKCGKPYSVHDKHFKPSMLIK